ncbi:coiled-coil domain-containing protein 137 [Agrilus planipennis]|uniref:Coiled-coil domain-containing protein 137 n=1 Tax=Agrilus planipennis TaxID=224129 RepID=A0A7F5R8J6_AGRPL|nr:coiled-coil domain-containing protein 137 [Agrilus planipennis]
MGRKIPGRKHRGVRDPEKQREQRLLRIKDKINAPPLNPDDQEIPKSLQELMQLKEKAQRKSKDKQNNKDAKPNFKPIMNLPNGVIYNFNSPRTFFDPKEKPAPIFMQEKGESDSSFIYRMNKVCESIIQETEFENKYSVKVHRSRQTGEVIKVTKRPKDELEELVKNAKKEVRKGKKKSKITNEPRLTKSQKRRKKLLQKKQQKQNNKELDSDRLNQKDTIKFGEIVHQPPTDFTHFVLLQTKFSKSGKGIMNGIKVLTPAIYTFRNCKV